eukprot:gene34138-47020_t
MPQQCADLCKDRCRSVMWSEDHECQASMTCDHSAADAVQDPHWSLYEKNRAQPHHHGVGTLLCVIAGVLLCC